MRIVRVICLLTLLTGLSLHRVDTANAQASPDVQQACTPDAMRLCSEFIPDVPKITACMNAKHSLLSVACRTAMSSHHEEHRAARHRHYYRRTARRREHCDKYSHLIAQRHYFTGQHSNSLGWMAISLLLHK